MGHGRPFLTAEWRWLAMANYEVDPAVIAPLVPTGAEIDFHGGRTYLSLVGFLFLNTRVLGVGVPLHRNFEEVNLRFYVRRAAEDGWRRGVVFVKEIVPRPAIAWAARVLYNENYVALPMRHCRAGQETSYSWRHNRRWHSLSVNVAGEPGPAAPGSEEEFITEHYWGYTAQRDGGTLEYRVDHPRWNVWAADASLSCDIAAFYGAEFAPWLGKKPSSAFLADGSAVTVYRGERLPAG